MSEHGHSTADASQWYPQAKHFLIYREKKEQGNALYTRQMFYSVYYVLLSYFYAFYAIIRWREKRTEGDRDATMVSICGCWSSWSES